MQDKSQQHSCVRAEERPQTSCVRAEGLQKYQESRVELEKQNSSKRNDAIVQPIVEDPVEDDSIPAETRARVIPAPCEPSEVEKIKHELTHIPFQPCARHASKPEAQADDAASDGLKVLSMHVKIVWVRHSQSCWNERCNRHVRSDMVSEKR